MTSIRNDIAMMMILGNKYSRFFTFIINSLYANSNINFKYMILPISYYDTSDYIKDTFKLAQSGYSYLIPSLAIGITQKDLVNLKDLENKSLKMIEKLIPLSSAYT
jgi:ABC-type multidrug transport system permease subunit